MRDAAEGRAIAARIQAAAARSTPAAMWRRFTIPARHRDRVRNLPQSACRMFWDVKP